MQACIEMISPQNKKPLYTRIREGFPQKKGLLEKTIGSIASKGL